MGLGKLIGNLVGDFFEGVSDVVDFVGDVVGDVFSFLTPEIDIPDFSELQADKNAKGVLVNKFTANGAIPVVYGTRQVGGNVVFLETSGGTNQYLYMAIVLCEGEINDITSIQINDKTVTWSGDITDNTQITVNSSDSNFFSGESLITCEPHFGSDTQPVSTLLSELDSWTADHKLLGLCYLAIKFEWNADKFGSLPTVNAVVQGKKIYNPNLDGTVGGSGSHRADNSSTWAYSDNPVLQLLDYLRNDRFGMGIANSYFDSNFADWKTASNVCDTDITPYSGASAIDLLDSHIVVDTSKKAIDNVKEFLKGCRGYLNFTAGKYRVLVETTGSASITLTEDNIIGGIAVGSKNKNSRYNRVIVSFINPEKNYQSDTAQFPPVNETGLISADTHAIMKADDGGLLLEGRFDFSMLTSPYQAQEMAEIILRRSRSSLNITFTADANALDLSIGDIVNVSHSTPSFSAKPFRVQGMTLNSNQTVSLECTEHQDSFYTFGTQQEVPTIPDTNLPDPFVVGSPSIAVTDELRVVNQEAISVLIVDVSATDEFVVDFEVQAKKNSDTEFINLGKASGKRFELFNVDDGIVYDVRARSVSSISRSVFISTNHTVVGKTAPPSNVTNFSVNVVHGDAHFSWTPISDLDLSHYIIRHSPLTSGATYADATKIVEKVSRPANTLSTSAMTGTYFIKAVDKLDLTSPVPASQVVLVNRVRDANLNVVATSTQNPLFSGTRTNTALGDGLVLDTTLVFDSATGNFDDAVGLLDGGTGTVQTSGTYDFDTFVDLGAKYTVNLTKSITATRKDYVDVFDSATGLFEDREGDFDGDPQVFDDVDSQILFATTDDNPAITVESGLTLTHTFTANTQINSNNFYRQQSVVFACEVVFPRVVDLACTLFELGGGGQGLSIGFHDTDTFRLAFGDGSTDAVGAGRVIVDVPKANLPTDGQLHTLVWEVNTSAIRGRIYVDDVLVGEATSSSLGGNNWSGTNFGGFISQLNQDSPAYSAIRHIAVSGTEPNVRWKYGFSGGLRHYRNQTITATLPTYTEFRKFDVSEATARAFKFKLDISSSSTSATHEVSNLSVALAMEDRTFAEKSLNSWGNQVPDSEAFDNWFGNNGTSVTANQIANPLNGQVTADEVARSGTATHRNVEKIIVHHDPGRYSISVYAKANTLSRVTLVYFLADYSAYLRAWFNLADGSVISSQNVGSGATIVSASIDAVGSEGWYRVSMIGDLTFTTATKLAIYPDVFNEAIDGSIYLWGAQVQKSTTLPTYESYVNSTGTKTVTFTNAFKELQGLIINPINLATGDFYAITNESATGFTVQFKNSAGNPVGRKFDYVAKGFGKLET